MKLRQEHPLVEMYKQAFLRGAIPKNTMHAAALSGKTHEELVKLLRETLSQSEMQNYSGEPWYKKHRKTLDGIREEIIKEEALTPEEYEKIADEVKKALGKKPEKKRPDFNFINRKRYDLYGKLHKKVEEKIIRKL